MVETIRRIQFARHTLDLMRLRVWPKSRGVRGARLPALFALKAGQFSLTHLYPCFHCLLSASRFCEPTRFMV